MYVTATAMQPATATNTHWLIAMASRIEIPQEEFQVWEFRESEPNGFSELVVTDGNDRTIHTMKKPTNDFRAICNGQTPAATTYWVVRNKDEHGSDIRTLMLPDDY